MILQWAWGVVKLDGADEAILGHLQRDGGITNKELAERIRLSASACLVRVERLREAGIITGFRAVIDWSKLGPGLDALAEIHLDGASSDRKAALAELIADHPCIVSALRAAEPHIFLIHVVAAGKSALDEFVNAAGRAGLALKVHRVHTVQEYVKAPSASLAPHIVRVA